MTCTTIGRHHDATERLRGQAGCPGPRRQSRLARLLSRLGGQLFHYRYVRAELIERMLEQRERGKGERS